MSQQYPATARESSGRRPQRTSAASEASFDFDAKSITSTSSRWTGTSMARSPSFLNLVNAIIKTQPVVPSQARREITSDQSYVEDLRRNSDDLGESDIPDQTSSPYLRNFPPAEQVSPNESYAPSADTLVGSEETRIWSPGGSGGLRAPEYRPRGVQKLGRIGREKEELWFEYLTQILGFEFHDKDLLEEALESPKSGVISTSGLTKVRSMRHGNEELARLGRRLMETVLAEQCYLLQFSAARASKHTSDILSEENLWNIGRNTYIVDFIRPPKWTDPNRSWIVKALWDDVHFQNKPRLIARSIQAIIGAIYLDQKGGFEAVKSAMIKLGLTFYAQPG